MLEVVFSESAKGSMRCAQHCGEGQSVENPCFGVFSSEPISPEKEKELLEKAQRQHLELQRIAIPLGGNPEDVFGLSLELSMGDIAAPLENGPRRKLFSEMFAEDFPDEPEREKAAEEYWRGCLTDLAELKRRSESGEPVRIWYDFTPDGMCGLYFTAAQLKKAAGRVSTVCLPLWEYRGGNAVLHTSWSEMAPEQFGGCLSLEKELPPSVRAYFARQWEILQTENAPLRAVVNGHLHSVDERFYDGFIRAAIPEGDFVMGNLIGSVLVRYQLRVSSWLVARRIRAMVGDGSLQVVKKGERPYLTVLRTAQSES